MTEIHRLADQTETEGPADYFTGRATIRGLFARDDPSRVTGAIVTFEPGARTAWHSHPLGQTLIVLDGLGWTQVEDEPVQEFAAGDILLCPPDRPHWHGASPDGPMTHAAIQEALDGTNVVWMHHVTDDEYLAGRHTAD
ncbi:MAG: cupin domain-containing protein [Acidimicrobiales bacterium]